MTYAVQDLVIRNVAPVDTGEITDLVAAAMSDGPLVRWLQPGPQYFAVFVEHAVRYGEVYATAEGDTGRLTGVALWFPFTAAVPPPAEYERRLGEITGVAVDRACRLGAALSTEHPVEPHHYLAYLAVRPGRQSRGLGSALLDRHHLRLDLAGLPAYLEANDPRNRDLYLRHGYQVRSVIELPDGPPLWTMWRQPMA
jgi:GNAT superfamily N-acetyltransferase